jgi:hypothetical protein
MIGFIFGLVVGVVAGAVGSYLFLRSNKAIATQINSAVNTATGTSKPLVGVVGSVPARVAIVVPAAGAALTAPAAVVAVPAPVIVGK